MKRITSCILVLTLGLLAGCGHRDTPESITKEIMTNFKSMADILDGVTDEASAKAAVPKIEAVRANMRDVAKRAKSVKATVADDKTMQQATAGDLAAVQSRMATAMARLSEKPEVMAILQPAMQGMENDM